MFVGVHMVDPCPCWFHSMINPCIKMNIDEIRCLLAQHHHFFSPVICMQFCLGLPVGLPAILWGQACPPTTYMSYYSKSTPKMDVRPLPAAAAWCPYKNWWTLETCAEHMCTVERLTKSVPRPSPEFLTIRVNLYFLFEMNTKRFKYFCSLLR